MTTPFVSPRPFKIPESVLVVIHTPDLEVLVLQRTDIGSWQSVTGSKDSWEESFAATAEREVWEETGLSAHAPGHVLVDWQLENNYAIFPSYLHRYAPGVTHNTERVFSLCVPRSSQIVLSPREHTAYRWLAWQEAVDCVFSASNAWAIESLPTRWAEQPGRLNG